MNRSSQSMNARFVGQRSGEVMSWQVSTSLARREMRLGLWPSTKRGRQVDFEFGKVLEAELVCCTVVVSIMKRMRERIA